MHQLGYKLCQAVTERIAWGMVLFYFYAFWTTGTITHTKENLLWVFTHVSFSDLKAECQRECITNLHWNVYCALCRKQLLILNQFCCYQTVFSAALRRAAFAGWLNKFFGLGWRRGYSLKSTRQVLSQWKTVF